MAKLTVEECRTLTIASFVARGILYPSDKLVPWTFDWPNGFYVQATYQDRRIASGELNPLCLILRPGSCPISASGTLHLSLGFRGGWVRFQEIEITSIPSPLQQGKRRFYFQCAECGKRVGKIYLPPGGDRFACRRCHGLTYRSCQEHNKRVDELVRSPRRIKQLLKSRDPRKTYPALIASLRMLGFKV